MLLPLAYNSYCFTSLSPSLFPAPSPPLPPLPWRFDCSLSDNRNQMHLLERCVINDKRCAIALWSFLIGFTWRGAHADATNSVWCCVVLLFTLFSFFLLLNSYFFFFLTSNRNGFNWLNLARVICVMIRFIRWNNTNGWSTRRKKKRGDHDPKVSDEKKNTKKGEGGGGETKKQRNMKKDKVDTEACL